MNNGSGYKLSNCTGGFKYKYKGAAHNFKTISRKVTDYNYHQMQVSKASTSWTDVEAPPSELAQESWGITVPFKLDEIEAFSWEVKGGLSTKSGSLAIKDFYCIGTNLTFPAEKPASQCSGGSSGSTTVSSSSARSSSSNATGGNNSSSSRAGSSSSIGNGSSSSALGSGSSSSIEGDSSSSEGDDTPIVLPQIVHSNALNSVNNGVNLQATSNATIQIFDLKGKAVRTLKFKPGNYIVQLADLPRGLYIAKATSESWKQTVKVMVK